MQRGCSGPRKLGGNAEGNVTEVADEHCDSSTKTCSFTNQRMATAHGGGEEAGTTNIEKAAKNTEER
jgi:hypothetical protein